jgi:hypothetical protein
MSATIIQFPQAKASEGWIDIFTSHDGWRSFDVLLPASHPAAGEVMRLIKASGALINYVTWEGDLVRRLKGKRGKGSVSIYCGRRGMRGIEGILPVDLADKLIAMVKAAGVPVRYDETVLPAA